MMTAHSPRPSPLVMSLPLELTELILIFTAILGFPEAIAVVAQTCQVMRTLIYDAPDQHLWREIYLTTFDDPRVSEGSDVSDHTQYHPNPCEDSGDKKDFNWGAEFRWRVWTANYVRRATSSGRMPPSGHPSFFPGTMLQSEMAANLVALESLLSVIKTALPYPPPAQIPPPSSSSSEKPPPTRHPTYPVFPHSPASYAPPARDTPIKGNGPSVLCPNAPDLSPSYVQSLNIRWFQSVLSSGFPPLLTARFSGDQLPGGPQGFWEGQVETKMMHTFGKLLTATGFLPIPFVGVVERRDASTQTEKQCDEDLHTGEEDGASSSSTISSIGIQTAEASFGSVSHQTILENEAETTFSSLSFNPNMTAEAQRRRARRVARMRVYNMRYLARERHWGPYLYPPASASGLYARPSAGDHEDDFLEPILSIFAEHEAGHPNHDQDDETSDSDDENHPYGDNGIPTGLREPIPLGPPPSPSLLRADWSYLAAVRVVVEANLREAVGPEELMGLMWLDGLRIGSAPREMLPGGQCKEECMYSEPSKGKGKEKDIGDGWDWAGVSGVWRRCVCWMDYRDLILHNLSLQFNDPTLQEAVRIIPMRLRIVGYTPSEVASFPDRPTIHVEGETAGPAGSSTTRKVHGSVMMIADGSVRWMLYSGNDESQDEWVTEGIQIGDATSAMGVLGMWTGAQHERMDPLGPFWAWKVG